MTVIQTADNSMSPIIKKDSYVGIKLYDEELFEGQIYLFHLQGIGLILRRIIEINEEKNQLVIASEDLNIPKKILLLSKIINVNYVKDYNDLLNADSFKMKTKIFKNNLNFLIGKAVWIMQEL